MRRGAASCYHAAVIVTLISYALRGATALHCRFTPPRLISIFAGARFLVAAAAATLMLPIEQRLLRDMPHMSLRYAPGAEHAMLLRYGYVDTATCLPLLR